MIIPQRYTFASQCRQPLAGHPAETKAPPDLGHLASTPQEKTPPLAPYGILDLLESPVTRDLLHPRWDTCAIVFGCEMVPPFGKDALYSKSSDLGTKRRRGKDASTVSEVRFLSFCPGPCLSIKWGRILKQYQYIIPDHLSP